MALWREKKQLSGTAVAVISKGINKICGELLLTSLTWTIVRSDFWYNIQHKGMI